MGHHPRADVGTDLGLISIDQGIERRRIDIALFDQQRF